MWKKFLHIFRGTPSKYEYSPQKIQHTQSNATSDGDTINFGKRQEEIEFKPKSKILNREKIVFQNEDNESASCDEYSDNELQKIPLPYLKFPECVSDSDDGFNFPNKVKKLDIKFQIYNSSVDSDDKKEEDVRSLPEDIENYQLESDIPLPYFKKDFDTPILKSKKNAEEKVNKKHLFKPNKFQKYELSESDDNDNNHEIQNNKIIRFGELKDKNKELKPKTSILKTNPFTVTDSDSDEIPIDSETKEINIWQLSPNEKNYEKDSIKQKNDITPKMTSFKPIKIKSNEKNDDNLSFISEYDSEYEEKDNFEKFTLKNNKTNKNKSQLSYNSFEFEQEPTPIKSSFLNKKSGVKNNNIKKNGKNSNPFQKY